jgi:hypothetical protein
MFGADVIIDGKQVIQEFIPQASIHTFHQRDDPVCALKIEAVERIRSRIRLSVGAGIGN